MGVYLRGKNYYIDYYVNGKRIRKSIGTNKRLAELVLAKIKVQLKEGEYFRQNISGITTFGEAVNDFLKYSRNNKKSYWRDLILTRHLVDFFGKETKLGEILPSRIEDYKQKRLNDGVSVATINRELSALRTIFNLAIKNKKVTENPIKHVKFFKEDNMSLRYLSHEEIEMLLNASDKYIKPVIICALATGMRRGEILNLTWLDIDLERRLIFVKSTNTKSGKMREIPISSTLYNALLECKKWSDGVYVFCNSEGRRYMDIRAAFEKAKRKAGLLDIRFHDLRHTFASHLVMSGVDLVTVKELLGHSSIATTMRYAHLAPGHKRTAVEILNKIIDTKWTQGQKLKKMSVFDYPVKFSDEFFTNFGGVAEWFKALVLKTSVGF